VLIARCINRTGGGCMYGCLWTCVSYCDRASVAFGNNRQVLLAIVAGDITSLDANTILGPITRARAR
jgi:hypothetical protein